MMGLGKNASRIGLGVVLLAAALTAHAAEGGRGEITVHVDQPTVALPPTLYGLFYEDINYSADGGLYAELVQNRSFEYYPVEGWNRRSDQMGPLYAWEKVATGGGQCTLSVESSDPLNANNPHYVRLGIQQPGDGVGLANRGFDGIPVAAGEIYDLSFYARRTSSVDTPVRASLQDEQGVIGRSEVEGLSGQWTKYEVSIAAERTRDRARLVLLTGGEGDVLLDMVSLFPRKTYKGRKNGLRADLVQALVDLKPAMFRFPGGCISHGHGLENAYRWKDTVGDVAQRKPNWNLWGYHQTYGLGYFEYFQLCEDIGAEPLPIVPVGVSCGFRQPFENAPLDQLQSWVDDAVDLIEFANGPADSRWGRVRAEMGHPEPFHLKYIGLGNEEHDTREFRERFPYFVRAIRAAAPEIQIVGTSGLGPQIPLYDFMAEQGVELSDEHYYESPEWFIANRNRFDAFDRGGPEVFVGEYASRGNRLYNAVAEAVYLTGIERNADIVPMTAYAPLFARYGFTQWQAANLIWFDHKTVVRTPNYYVQQMFAWNKGDRYLKNEAEFELRPADQASPARGRVGVGTWSTTAAFDDLQVRSGEQLLLGEDFSGDAASWEAASGEYEIRDGAYHQAATRPTPAMSVCRKMIDAAQATITLRAKKTGGREGFLILFGRKESGGYYWWNVGGWGNTQHAIEKGGRSYQDGKSLVASRPGRIEADRWYDIRIEIAGGRIRCFLDEQLVHDVREVVPEPAVAASREDTTGDILLKIANPLDQACRTQVQLQGVDSVQPTGTLTLLAGDRDDANDLEAPNRVAPLVRELPVATRFEYEIPPMSVQFLRIPTK